MKKLISIPELISMVKDGMTLMIGGFLANGTPETIVDALVQSGVKNLTIIANDTSFPDRGLGKLVANKQVSKMITSHIGTNAATAEQFNAKELEIEFVPQGTLAERVRAGGSGLGGILTQTGLGTIVAEGKQIINISGKEYLLETPLRADMAFISASVCDTEGNLVYKGTSKNFNPLMAMAADVVVVEAKEMVAAGSIAVEQVHTSAIFVDYILAI
jgi:acetate CoA/acetoacetate CoA-transferase alpha subunit